MTISEELYNLLNGQNWENIIVKLTAYTVWLCLRIPTDQEPEDIAMAAIAKVYEGQRNWNPADEPDLLRYLKSVVKSMVSNDVTSSNSVKKAHSIEIEALSPAYHDYVDEELYARQLNERIMNDLQADPELCLVYKALKDQYSPKEISEEYGLPVTIVQNAQKRLKRIATRVIAGVERKEHGTEKV